MDEEESRAFFAREEENRKRQAERVRRAMMLASSDSEVKGKKRKSTSGSDAPEKGAESRDDTDDDDELFSDEDVGSLVEGDSSPSPQHVIDTSDEVMEDTPLSSQSHQADDHSGEPQGKSFEGATAAACRDEASFQGQRGSADEDEDDDEVPVGVEPKSTLSGRLYCRQGGDDG